MSRYKETPKGSAEQVPMYWEGRVTYPTHISGK